MTHAVEVAEAVVKIYYHDILLRGQYDNVGTCVIEALKKEAEGI